MTVGYILGGVGVLAVVAICQYVLGVRHGYAVARDEITRQREAKAGDRVIHLPDSASQP